MNELQAKEEIRLIREMIDKTKKITAGSWTFFIAWGILAILAIIVMYGLVSIEKYQWIWINWIVFMGIGVIYTIVTAAKQELLRGMKTYAHVSFANLCIACGVGFTLVGFVFPALNLYTYGEIPVFISLIAGILTFGGGGIFEWNLLKWCGAIWWLGALGMVFIHRDYRALFFVPLIIVGYLVPGLVLRSMYQKSRAVNES